MHCRVLSNKGQSIKYFFFGHVTQFAIDLLCYVTVLCSFHLRLQSIINHSVGLQQPKKRVTMYRKEVP